MRQSLKSSRKFSRTNSLRDFGIRSGIRKLRKIFPRKPEQTLKLKPRTESIVHLRQFDKDQFITLADLTDSYSPRTEDYPTPRRLSDGSRDKGFEDDEEIIGGSCIVRPTVKRT
mgnify:CR=1 FL=1